MSSGNKLSYCMKRTIIHFIAKRGWRKPRDNMKVLKRFKNFEFQTSKAWSFLEATTKTVKKDATHDWLDRFI